MDRANNQNLASILGITKKKPRVDVKELKEAAFLRFKTLLKGDDTKSQMAALDDYISVMDLEDDDGTIDEDSG